MRFVQASSLDSIDDYRLLEGETPRPGPGEVVIKVAACGVGYVDALVSLGRYQVKPALPHIPGGKIPETLAKITRKSMARRQEDRYQTVKEFQAAVHGDDFSRRFRTHHMRSAGG